MKKTLLIIVVILVLILLMHISFFSVASNDFKDIGNFELKNGVYSLELDIENDTINYLDYGGEDNLNIRFINIADKILYKGDFDIVNTSGVININLGKGIYLININELNSKFIINGEGFEVANNGPATLYIDTSGDKTTIFSQNAVIETKLSDIQNNDLVNTVYLYPHMHIKFIPSQNSNVKNADILRLTQWFPVDYFNEQILIGNEINPSFSSKVTGTQNIDIIEKMFLYLGMNYEESNNYLDNFQVEKFGTLTGEKLIKEYSKIFLNDAKKIIYYKNTILRGLGDLIGSSSLLEDEVNFIIEMMEEIKQINEEDYLEMKKIVYFYLSLVIGSYENNEFSKINFSKLYNSLEGNTFTFQDYYVLQLNNIYLKLDIQEVTNILKFNDMYSELGTMIKSIINIETDQQKSYLVLFLNKIIISGFTLGVDIKNIIPILNEYTNLSLDYYDKNDETRVRTGIAEYSKVIEEIVGNMRNYFFQPERDSNDILLLNEKNIVPTNQITTLEDNVNKIFSYFDNNKDKLWEKESASYISSFERTQKLSTEYFSALKNYDLYTINAKNEDRELLFGEDNINNSSNLNENYALAYLQTFNYLDLSNTKISLRDYNYCELNGKDTEISDNAIPYCYKIENVKIYGVINIDFDLTPSDYNKISNIKIDGDATINRGTYRLDKEKTILGETNINSSSSSEENIYVFENFFYFTFAEKSSSNQGNNNNTDENNIPEEIPQEVLNETATIKAFKSILLGRGGELYSINTLINATYNNVIVTEVSGGYNIQINNAALHYQDNNGDFEGTFSSKYIHSPEFVFENPEFTLDGIDELANSKIILKGKYKIKEFENYLKLFFDNNDILISILNSINSSLNINNFNITYSDISSNILKIENEIIEININGYIINSIKYKGKEILEKSISTFDLNKTLNSLR